MIKLLVIDPSDGEDTQKIITEIISGLNSQTAIGPVTLDLNNDFTMNIQSILRNKNLPNDKRVYIEIRPGEFTKNKHYKAQKDQILQMSTLMQYLFSTNWFTKNSISIGSIRSSKATTIRRYSKVLEDDVTTRLEHLNEQDKNKIWVLLVNLISIFEKSWGTFVHDPKKEKLEGINYLKFAAFRLIVNTHKLEFSIQSLQKGTEDYHKFKWFEDSISSLSKTMEAYTKANGQVNWDQFSKKLEFEELLKIDSTKTF